MAMAASPNHPSSSSSPSSSSLVEWSTHTFCTYTICRASLPAREGLHDLDIHFTHLPLKATPTSNERSMNAVTKALKAARTKESERRKSSAVVFTGREEWMGTEAEEEEEEAELEVDDGLVGMEGLSPILSEE